MRNILIIFTFLIVGCSTTPSDAFKKVTQRADNTAKVVTKEQPVDDVDSLGDTSNLGDAALTPLQDINLRQVEIPEVLNNMENPYLPPLNGSCRGLMIEIAEYNRLLGPDFDDLDAEGKSMETTALNAVSSTVGGLIPFRGLVRAASGASSYDKKVERAYRKGVSRRGYLKGLAAANQC